MTEKTLREELREAIDKVNAIDKTVAVNTVKHDAIARNVRTAKNTLFAIILICLGMVGGSIKCSNDLENKQITSAANYENDKRNLGSQINTLFYQDIDLKNKIDVIKITVDSFVALQKQMKKDQEEFEKHFNRTRDGSVGKIQSDTNINENIPWEMYKIN
jgi:hypothetical protein